MSTDENINFLSLTEAASMISKPKEYLLRLAIERKIELFFRFSTERVETGKLNLAPSESNHIEWPGGKITQYAHPLCPEAEHHMHPEFLESSGYEYPDRLPILLLPRHVQSILNERELLIKYGWLPNGTAFNVVDPPKGVRVIAAGILITEGAISSLMGATAPTSSLSSEISQEAGGQEHALSIDQTPGQDDVLYYSWGKMEPVTGYSRNTIRSRAEAAGIKIQKDDGRFGLTDNEVNQIRAIRKKYSRT